MNEIFNDSVPLAYGDYKGVSILDDKITFYAINILPEIYYTIP